MPTVIEGRSGTCSERRRTPFARRVWRIGLPVRLLLVSVLHRLLPGEADLAGPVDLEDLDVDDVALLQDVGDPLHALVGELGDVHEAVRAREDLHEGAEV